MKKILPYIVLAAVALALFLPASQPAVMGVVTLPDPLSGIIQAAFVFAVGWAFAQIGAVIPWFTQFFGQYADTIAFTLAGVVIALVNKYLGMIPPVWETPANIFLGFLVAVLVALQTFHLLGRAKVPTFRA